MSGRRYRDGRRLKQFGAVAFALVVPAAVLAATNWTMWTSDFVPGTPIKSDDVDRNFATLRGAIVALEAEVAALKQGNFGGPVTATQVVGDSFKYPAAKTFFRAISALGFTGEGIIRHTGFGEAYLAPGRVQAWSEVLVHLPEGAVITSLQCKISDPDPAGQINLILRRHSGRADQEIARVSSPAAFADSAVQILTSSVPNHVVSNETHAYYMELFIDSSGTNGQVKFHDCRITYLMTSVDQ